MDCVWTFDSWGEVQEAARSLALCRRQRVAALPVSSGEPDLRRPELGGEGAQA